MIVRSRLYLKNAGTFIAAMAFAIWLLANVPANFRDIDYYKAITLKESARDEVQFLNAKEYIMEHSALGAIGKVFEPILSPLGFDWKLNVSFLAATAAKEVAIS